MFQVRSKFGNGFTVPKIRARASARRKLAYRPHIAKIWDDRPTCSRWLRTHANAPAVFGRHCIPLERHEGAWRYVTTRLREEPIMDREHIKGAADKAKGAVKQGNRVKEVRDKGRKC